MVFRKLLHELAPKPRPNATLPSPDGPGPGPKAWAAVQVVPSERNRLSYLGDGFFGQRDPVWSGRLKWHDASMSPLLGPLLGLLVCINHDYWCLLCLLGLTMID